MTFDGDLYLELRRTRDCLAFLGQPKQRRASAATRLLDILGTTLTNATVAADQLPGNLNAQNARDDAKLALEVLQNALRKGDL